MNFESTRLMPISADDREKRNSKKARHLSYMVAANARKDIVSRSNLRIQEDFC
jgi:hypothetical protein